MSSRSEVLIRILALLQRKTLIAKKKSHIKMLKMALFDRAINEKCCIVDGGRGICPLFSSPPGVFDSSRVPTPGNLPSKAKKMQCPGVSRGGGAGRRLA